MTLPYCCALILAPTLFLLVQLANAQQQRQPVQGTKCARNQVVSKLTVYDDGAIEAECGPMPCGTSGLECIENNSACRAESHVFSGMSWAANGQSLILRCCSYNVPNKVYVGTDLINLGHYYTGGVVAKADEMVGKGGHEYDFVVNARTEQNGVRIWVYRIICPAEQQSGQPQQQQQQQYQQQQQQQQQQKQFDLAAIEAARQQTQAKNQAYEQRRQNFFKQISENRDAPTESIAAPARDHEEEAVVNPLQYRPAQHRQRDAPLPAAEQLPQRLL